MAAEDQEFVVLNASDVQGFNHEGILPLPSKKISQIQAWLEPTDYAVTSSEYGKHSASHLAGTGTWILQTGQYKQWHDSDRGALWIKAIAGAGKSVVAASLTSSLGTEKVPVLYFFFRQIVSANQKPQSLVRDYMSQLLEDSPELQHSLHKLVDTRRSLDSMSLDDLWKILVSALARFPRVYCVADALDEMDTGNELFLDNLVTLAQKDPTAIKVLMTSRPVPQVERILRHPSVLQISMEPRLVHPDISAYVQHRVSQCNISEALRSQIHKMMCARADGHFLYARLMMDDLLEPSKKLLSHEADLLLALNSLPAPMADMYSQMLLDHSKRSAVPPELQLELLQSVTGAERPLRLLELSSMVEFNATALDLSRGTKSIVRESCGPLLEILEDETVCPIHHSFTEYLYDTDRQRVDSKPVDFAVLEYTETQRTIAVTCIRYLASGWHHEWQKQSENEQKRAIVKMKYPFLDYAASNWHEHVRKSGATDTAMALELDSLLLKDPEILPYWLELTADKKSASRLQDREVMKTWKALHAAAAHGLGFYVEHLIEKGHDIECLDLDEHSPLALAACNGHDEVVTVLLRSGARNDEADNVGKKPLHLAAERNHSGIVKLLLESGVDPHTPKTVEYPGRWCGNSPSSVGETPVEYACKNGHVETVEAFIPYLKSDGLSRALYWAINSTQTKVAIALLQAPGIDINSVVHNQTPLYLASMARDIELMGLLLAKKADVFALSCRSSSRRGWTSLGDPVRSFSPLHAFVRYNGDGRIRSDVDMKMMDTGIEMLLNAGLDPNMADPQGLTILHNIVTYPENENTLRMLLDRGLSAITLARDGSNALHQASNLSGEVLDMLITCGVDINHVRKDDRKTPLMTALARGDVVAAQNFLDKGADANLADSDGNTPLHLVSKLSSHHVKQDMNLGMVKRLIAAGADVNGRNKDGNTPMHLDGVNRELLSVFLEHGFDLEAKNKKGHTVLFHIISRWGLDEWYKTLVDAGANSLTRDSQGSTILHVILGRIDHGTSTIDRLHYFVQKGVDPLSIDDFGHTLWHTVARLGADLHQEEQLVIRNLLVEYGVPPMTRNYGGQTPLHVAFSIARNNYRYGPIEFLLEHTNADLNDSDYDKIRPIHLTSSFDPELTCYLLEHGADPTVVTVEGQSPLMVACRTRQCNIVCILLDYYKDHNQLSFINHVDNRGFSALHYAGKSGRPETVAMLLGAGADPNLKNKDELTPLHMCAEYLDEQASWDRAESLSKTRQEFGAKAAYVLSTDLSRPSRNTSQEDPIRIRETVRLLVAAGATTDFLIMKPDLHPVYFSRRTVNPLAYAISKGCEAMVSELLIIQDRLIQAGSSQFEAEAPSTNESGNKLNEDSDTVKKQWANVLNRFDSRVRFLRMRHMPELVAENIGSADANVSLVQKLLKEDDELSVKEASRLGVTFLELDFAGESPLIQMAKWGFTDLMRAVGQGASQMNSAWRTAKAQLNENWREERLKPILYTALTRQTPNLEMVKLLVSEFMLNPNELFSDGRYEAVNQSYVHLLACPNHWWQTKALEFLLENGANVEALNSRQETPLIAALRHLDIERSPTRMRAVDILLRYGANPSVADEDGLTCLNIATGQLALKLLKNGADPSLGRRPFIFDAIGEQNLDALHLIVESGVSVNVLAQRRPEPEVEELDIPEDFQRLVKQYHPQGSWDETLDVEDLSENAYPIHVAASRYCNDTPEEKEKSLEIINLLLKAGADPFMFYEDGTGILHTLAEYGGVLEPFFNHTSFDTESRDNRGRTLLLAACNVNFDVGSPFDTTLIPRLIERGASLTAVDQDGCNALHYLISNLPPKRGLHSDFSSFSQPFMPVLVAEPNLQGRTPFHYAVAASRFDLIDMLIENGADPLIPDPLDGSTALHHLAASLAERKDMLIHDPRARMTAEDFYEISTGKNADTVSDDAVHEYVRTKLLRDEKLASALLSSPRRHFESLISHGLSIEARDHAGETPLFKLMTATLKNHRYKGTDMMFPTLRVFENANANFKVRNNIGESVLHKLATQLIRVDPYSKRGADFNPNADLQKTFRYLVEKGVDVTWEDEANRTCLDVAAATGAEWVLDMYKRK